MNARSLLARSRWRLSAVALAMLLIGCAQPQAAQPPVDTVAPIVLDAPRPLTDWTLPSSSGSDLRLSDLRGRYALLFFGYTHCPDFCPTTLGDYKLVKRELGDAATDLAFVMVSVDGQRDTPEVLARYMTTFDPSFIGLSGDGATLDSVAKEYGLYYKLRTDEANGASYPVDHTTMSYLIDRDGRLIALYPYEMTPEAIAADLRTRV